MYFDPKEVGKRIAKLRELLGYNQEQYSQKINISRSALSKIEIGDRSPSIDLLIEIAELSGVTLDYLILGRTPQEGNKKLGMQLVISFLTELEREMYLCTDCATVAHCQSIGLSVYFQYNLIKVKNTN